jgi:hypothetical protein
MLLLPAMAVAQEATLSGRVSDSTGGALPGVTVQAVHEASGNTFEGVTDERGEYRLALRVGGYRVTAQLSGFTPVTRTLTLLIGQQAVANLELTVSGVQESVTVTGEAPLLDVTESSLGGNIDPRQMSELPVQGRNWIDLILLAPGAQVNAVDNTPSDSGRLFAGGNRMGSDFQLNVDGQEITQAVDGSGGRLNPRYSKDAIAEFEFLSSRFDATQGRSAGLQVNAVTKSGTNTPSGSFSGYFRDDRFNAADHVAKRVLPYENQQFSGTFGGPIRRDRIHFFANYEYEREPQTLLYTTPFAHFNSDLSVDNNEKKGGVRLDGQISRQTRLMVRAFAWRLFDPSGGGGNATPTSASADRTKANQLFSTLTQVLGNRSVNEIKIGWASAGTAKTLLRELRNPNTRFPNLPNGPVILLRGFSAGGAARLPEQQAQDTYSVRDDFTYSFTKGGSHTLKLGAEYLYRTILDLRCVICDGELTASAGPVPANIESIFPDLYDVTTWNLAPLSPISVRWRQDFGNSFRSVIPRYSTGIWFQDDWAMLPRLTLNLGIRYDVEINAFANDANLGPFLPGGQPNDLNNLAPRLGFSFAQNDRMVIRGGYGLYFGTVTNAHYAKLYEATAGLEVPNDGRPDFASNPWNGPLPTYEDIAANFCTPELKPGCRRREIITGGAVYGPDMVMPYSHQASLGLQRQIGTTMAVEADYVYRGHRKISADLPLNVTYNPATGANYPFSDISRRPFPEFGYVSLGINGGRSNSHALQTAFTKRFSNGWQASSTYTLSALRDADPCPLEWDGDSFEPVPFPVAPDLGCEHGPGIGEQRHRAVFNGVWEPAFGFQLSGLYFYGSGERLPTRYGTDERQLGGFRPNQLRLRPNGTIVPRNDFVAPSIHRVDLRFQQRVPLAGRARVDGILEVFNVFNRANFGSFGGIGGFGPQGEVSSNYKQPAQNRNVAFAPRTLQIGFRLTF